jgi:hypothetical protein
MTFIMAVVVSLVKWLLPDHVLLETVVSGGFGFAVYLVMAQN